eukprot:7383461-Prymnesium_polylepis.1
MNKPFPGGEGRAEKVGIDYLQGIIFEKEYTQGYVFGDVKREVNGKVTYKIGSKNGKNDKYHFLVENDQEWTILVQAVCNLVRKTCNVSKSVKPKKSIAKKASRSCEGSGAGTSS